MRLFKIVSPTICGLCIACLSLSGCNKSPTNTSPENSLQIAAAASLRYVLPELVSTFKTTYPAYSVTVTYGASGTLYAQILNQAPFDLFLSADTTYPEQPAEKASNIDDTPFVYGKGEIVLWTNFDSPIDPEQDQWEALRRPSVQRIAIANPHLAPYGKAAMEALQQVGLYEDLSARLVLGETITQTAQFVESGAASIGLIARSLAVGSPLTEKGKYWVIPQNTYTPVHHGGIVLSNGSAVEAARIFQHFLLTAEAQHLLKEYGF